LAPTVTSPPPIYPLSLHDALPISRQRIEAVAATLPVNVRHLWQPDDGFRKCEAMNMAIGAAASDYLIFTDGDCIPRADFVSTHLDRKSTRLNSSHVKISYAVFGLK